MSGIGLNSQSMRDPIPLSSMGEADKGLTSVKNFKVSDSVGQKLTKLTSLAIFFQSDTRKHEHDLSFSDALSYIHCL